MKPIRWQIKYETINEIDCSKIDRKFWYRIMRELQMNLEKQIHFQIMMPIKRTLRDKYLYF